MQKQLDSVHHHCAARQSGGGQTPARATLASLFEKMGLRRKVMRFLLAALAALSLGGVPVWGQTEPPCLMPNCDKLMIEAVRVYDNVATTCTDNDVPCGDRFSQIFFKIYLRMEVPAGTAPFNLDYSTLDVSVRLKNANLPIQYSHINTQATDNCFKTSTNGAKWFGFNDADGNKVIWEPTEKEVAVSFANLDLNGPNCGVTAPGGLSTNQIGFTFGQPDCTAACGSLSMHCAYVELFTVVVNAYPGETVSLEMGERMYVPKSDPTSNCSPIGVVSGTPNLNCLAVFNGAPIAAPPTFASTANADIEAMLLDPVADGNGGYSVDIQVKNNSASQSMSLNYLEFVVKTTLFQVDKPLQYVGHTPREVDGGLVSGNPFERIVYLHYRVNANGQALAPGGTWTLGTIKFGPPILTNQAWGATLAFHESGSKSRLKTTAPACTTLKTSGTPAFNEPGMALCSNIGISFRITGQVGSCSGAPAAAKVGFNSVVPGPWKIRKMNFSVTFDLDPGVSIANVSFPDWPFVSCDIYDCYSTTPLQCWEVSPDGKTLTYCFITPDNDPIVFDLDPEVYMLVEFSDTGNGCVKGATTTFIETTYILVNNSSVHCIPPVETPTGFPQCGPAITGRLATAAGSGLEDATVKIKAATCASANCTGACPDKTTSSAQTGTFGFCSICANCDKFDVVPEKNNDPLNGVSTFDLVLINKHVLGTEPFNSPYKIIAADANKSKSVTTFDIVVLRKLILGIFSQFPDNTSWRFVDANFSFPNPVNPFQTIFPESILCLAPPATGLDFVAVKVGDVNGNAITSTRPGGRPTLPISFGTVGARSRGGVFTVPVTYTGERKIEALQMGLHFDPSRLELLGPSKGNLPDYTADHFGLARAAEGEIRTLWLSSTGDEYDRIAAGTVLFYLTFRARTDMPDSVPLLLLDDAVLDNAAWEADGSEYALVPDPTAAQRDEAVHAATAAGLRASVRPNPSSGEVLFSVYAPQAGPGRIALFDAFGKMIFIRRVEFAVGDQDEPAPEAAGLPPGVYVWRVFAGEQKVGGHLIRH
ncbi:MAG: cohesin domain-containing protein [Saprospiraceae bacterium]